MNFLNEIYPGIILEKCKILHVNYGTVLENFKPEDQLSCSSSETFFLSKVMVTI